MTTSKNRRRPRQRKRPPGSTLAHGYGPEHKRLRIELLAALDQHPGIPCPQSFPDGTTCGRPMYPGQELHLGHTLDRAGYIGLVHAVCNLRAAQLWAQWRRARGIKRIVKRAVRGRRPW